MFVCGELQTEVWQPDFSSSGQTSVPWTRVRCGSHAITNSLQWVEWSENPVQVLLCESCGIEGCAVGGYVHVSRLGDYALWSAPQISDDSEPAQFLRTLGALAIPMATWTQLLPGVSHLAPANHAAVADAWILGPGRSATSIIAFLEAKLAGGDTLSKAEAIALVERTLTSFRARATSPFEQPLLTLAESGARMETLHFEGAPKLDWPAFAFADGATYAVLERSGIIVSIDG
ncbi:MAG TPA: hypothetical protein VFN10_00425 [Thermoanaerobaculia bacterium]|nr:hypothetical protein [Thermoanaerobaculia bacterium]